MNTWFTSDTHFGHKNIMKFCPNSRGHYASVGDMDQAMIDNWNYLVDDNDEVYHLGDFAFAPQGRIKEILSQLKGRIYILAGNHDKGLRGPLGQFLVDTSLIAGLIPACTLISVGADKFVLNHYSMRVWDRSHYGVMHLYGHSHGSLPGYGKSVDVGVDSIEMGEFVGRYMYPFNSTEVVDFLNDKDIEKPDHHKERK